MRVRRRLKWIAAAAVVGAVVAVVVLSYPAFIPKRLNQPAFNVDPAEGKVWVNSEIVVEVRGRLSPEEALKVLEFTPPITLRASDITVEYSAPLAGHDVLPWSTTKITVNRARGALFTPDTQYKLTLEDAVTEFETITLPAIVSAYADGKPPGDLDDVPTSRDIVIVFNEEVSWNDRLLQIEPEIDFSTAVESRPNGATAVRVQPPVRWENATRYSLRIDGAVEDAFGHTGDVTFATEFTTWPAPTVTAAAPQGASQPLESLVQVEFERDVDRSTVEASFRTEPALSGVFEWQNDHLLVWRPQGFQHSTSYKISVAGSAVGGDPIVPLEWSFRTQDPPVFVEIRGRDRAPTVLEAVPTGGLGSYSLLWSTGETDRKILFPGGGTQPHNVEVTVTSGDRTATRAIQIAPAPDDGFTPAACPIGWELIAVSVCYRAEEIPGPVRAFVARIDPRDPNLQARAVPAGAALGTAQTTSAAARVSSSMVAVNGDFFYTWERGSFTLGPMVWGGNFIYAPASPETVLALGRDRTAWIGPSAELKFALQSADGTALGLQGVNHIPVENAASVFNGYWGPELDLGFEGCFATFIPIDQTARVPDQFACGPLVDIPLQAGAYVIAGTGAAADWMRAQSANPLAVVHSFPLSADVDFMVAGSHALVQDGVLPEIKPDRRHPRTAIGVDAGGFLYLLVVDGRSKESLGMTLPELQAYAAGLGLTNAINLDGGGSSTLVVGQSVVNKPSAGRERAVPGIVEIGAPRPACLHPFVRC
jgi:hypothetical protein